MGAVGGYQLRFQWRASSLRDERRGRPVVLIHGFSATAEMWDPVRADLSSRYWVIAMDCRGHGRSGKPHDPGAYGIAMVNDVIALLDHYARVQ